MKSIHWLFGKRPDRSRGVSILTPTIGERARRAVQSLARKKREDRVCLDREIFDALREHMQLIQNAIEREVLSASLEGRCECAVGYDGISLRDYMNPPLCEEDIEKNGAVLELKHWAIVEGLCLEVIIEQAPQGAIGFHAMKFPRFRFDVSWPDNGRCAPIT